MHRRYGLPLLGMAFFWAYFRYPTFFGFLYPLDNTFTVGNASYAYYSLFLCFLFLISAFALLFSAPLKQLLYEKRILALGGTLLGSLGVLMALLAHNGCIAPWFLGVSAALTAFGFVNTYLMWAFSFSSTFDARKLTVLVGSYALSLLLFSVLTKISWLHPLVLIALPLFSGLCWWYSEMPKTEQPPATKSLSRQIELPLILCMVFLLTGSVIRGMTDISNITLEALSFRQSVSILMALLLFFICLVYFRKSLKKQVTTQGNPPAPSIRRFTLMSWIAFSLIFFLGLFIWSVLHDASTGGQIVVIARSMFDLLLWLMLCNFSSDKKISPLPLFILCGLFTELFSWLLSYQLLPFLLHSGIIPHIDLSQGLILAITFTLSASITLLLGIMAVGKRNPSLRDEKAPSPHLSDSFHGRLQDCGLTHREIEVALLFSEGRSLKKVASALFISPSTAQSHVKSIYRKLDIHSKDELIDIIQNYH